MTMKTQMTRRVQIILTVLINDIELRQYCSDVSKTNLNARVSPVLGMIFVVVTFCKNTGNVIVNPYVGMVIGLRPLDTIT